MSANPAVESCRRVHSDASASTRLRAVTTRVLPELVGAAFALAVSLVAVWSLATGPRHAILFNTGDSMILSLMHASAVAGEPQRWVFSSVLFIPERALYGAVALLGMSVRSTLIAVAVLNFVLLAACLRGAAALVLRDRSGRVQRACASGAFAVLAVLTLLETNPSTADSFDLMTFMGTSTYYSGTVFALIVSAALAGASVRAGSSWRPLVALGAVAALSTMSNPLFVLWVTGPLVCVLLLTVVLRVLPLTALLRVGGSIAGGSALGFALRLPSSGAIDPVTVVGQLSTSGDLRYLGGAFLRWQLSTPAEVCGTLILVFLLIVSVALLIAALTAADRVAIVVAGFAVFSPLLATFGTLSMGAPSTRYMQPLFYAPVVGLLILPRLLPALRLGRSAAGAALGLGPATTGSALGARFARLRLPLALPSGLLGAAVLIATTIGVAGSGVVHTAQATDQSIGCVDAWVAQSHEFGAGEFWTVRGPKAYLAQPDQLIQVDTHLDAFQWLVNRSDFRVRTVSFTVSSPASPPFVLSAAQRALPHSTIRCGRYTIADYHRPVLRLGPLRDSEAG